MGTHQIKVKLAIIPIAAILIFVFNNCGSKKSENSQSSELASVTTDGGSDTGSNSGMGSSVASFKTGDSLSKEQLQNVSSVLANFYDSYSVAAIESKAMAISIDGTGVVGLHSYDQNVSGIDKHIISICNVRFQKDCVLLAKGNNFVIDSSSLQSLKATNTFSGYHINAVKGQKMDVANFPFQKGHPTISDYYASTGVKSMVVSWNGGLVWKASADASLTQTEISRMTVESCQLASLRKCSLLVEGNTYALDYKTDKMLWSLPSAGQALNLAAIPLVNDKYRTDAQASVYNSYISSGGHGVIYLVQGGGATMRVSKTETVEQLKATALDTCKNAYPNKECLLYAIDKVVSWAIVERK